MSAYAELAVTTNFSFLRGASHPQEMVATAEELELAAIGIADRNSFAGVVRAYDEAQKQKTSSSSSARASSPSMVSRCSPIRPIAQAYGRLCRLLTAGNLKAKKGECHLTFEEILAASEGQILIALPPRTLCSERCLHRAASPPWSAQRRVAPSSPASIIIAATSRAGSAYLAELGERLNAPLVAVNDVSYHAPERRPLADVLTCVREKCTIAEAGLRLAVNAERHLKAGGGDGAAVRRLSRRHCPHRRDRRSLPLLARRAEIRISRRAGAGRQDRPAASRGPHLGGRAGALPARQISATAFLPMSQKRLA